MRSPVIEQLFVEDIKVVNRRRDVSDEKVTMLADSIARIGLRTPITIRSNNDSMALLVAGAHRLAAVKQLGWEKVDCIVLDCDEVDAELWEIAENLHRAELTVLERGEQIGRWVVLAKERAERISSQVATKTKGRPESGERQAARDLHLGKDEVNRAVKIASLSEQAKQVARETGLDDNQSALLAAAKVEPARQAQVIRDHSTAPTRSKIDADVKVRAAREVAEIIAEHVPGEWWDGLKANLYAAGAANIAHELTNITGQSIMDKRYA